MLAPRRIRRRNLSQPRRGAAVVEFAVLVPFLIFLIVIAVDFARIFYFDVTIVNAARSGAVYGSARPEKAIDTAGIQAVALADVSNLSPTPTVSSTIGANAFGDYIEVTVVYPFETITNYPGVQSNINLTRTVRMRVAPEAPRPY